MSVEIWLCTAKFSEFPQNARVYDDFPTAQPRVQVPIGGGFFCGDSCYSAVAVASTLREKNGKEASEFVVGRLNSRNGRLVSSFTGSDFRSL